MPKPTRQRKYHEKMLSQGLKYIHVYVPENKAEEYKRLAKNEVDTYLNEEKHNGKIGNQQSNTGRESGATSRSEVPA